MTDSPTTAPADAAPAPAPASGPLPQSEPQPQSQPQSPSQSRLQPQSPSPSLLQSQPSSQSTKPNRRINPATLPNRAALAIGVALALTATNPTDLAGRGPVDWLLTAAAVVAAIWAAPVVVQRPATETVHWNSQLVRHRNTVFAVGCTIVAGFDDPPIWLMAVDAALLLAYLLAVDALAAGPIGIRQLRRAAVPSAAAVASAVTLLGAQAPVDSGTIWGRVVAAVAVATAAFAAGAALWIRRQAGAQDSNSAREEQVTSPARQQSNTAPRHR